MSDYYHQDDGYIAAAKRVREKRAAYFAACAARVWDDAAVRLAHAEYDDALEIARREEDRVIAESKARQFGVNQIVNRSPVRFRS